MTRHQACSGVGALYRPLGSRISASSHSEKVTRQIYIARRAPQVTKSPSHRRRSRVILEAEGLTAMIQTVEAKVEWNAEKKHWQVVIHAGAEVIRRQCADTPQE